MHITLQLQEVDEPVFDCMQALLSRPLANLWEGYADLAAWLVILWSAVGPGALAAFLQTQASCLASQLHEFALDLKCVTLLLVRQPRLAGSGQKRIASAVVSAVCNM